jgi:glutathione S-transferase
MVSDYFRLNQSRAQRIVWLLEELNVDYEIKVYKRKPDFLAPDELKDIHPLGKSPVIKVQGPNTTQPKIIAESATIVEYLIDHFGKSLIPVRYPAGKEDQVGAETEEWFRWRYYMHYAEGSLMSLLMVCLFNDREFPINAFDAMRHAEVHGQASETLQCHFSSSQSPEASPLALTLLFSTRISSFSLTSWNSNSRAARKTANSSPALPSPELTS